MSGFACIYHLDNRPVAPMDLTKMVDALAERGPDDAHIWHHGVVGLGHRMLWTTPESLHEKLPLAAQTSQSIITADARVDNRSELIPLLGLGEKAAEVSDSQIILSAYEKWGERCPEKLVGDFAFAIWDERQKQLFCARDHLGMKPFFYFGDRNNFVCASQIKALVSLPYVPRCLNEVRVADFLTKTFEDKEITFYQDIFRLAPANAMVVTRQGVRRWQYWRPDTSYEVKLGSNEEYAAAFLEIFTEAVRCRLRSAFPIGSTLSGGLDSSSVACVAARLLAESGRSGLHTFSAVFPTIARVDARIDERKYIDAVLASGQFESHFMEADRLSPLVHTFWQADEPIPGVNLYMDHGFAKVAQRHNVRVLLTGHDGDSVVSYGYERLTELARTLEWKTLFNESAALARGLNVRHRSVIWHQVIKPLLSQSFITLWPKRTAHSQLAWQADNAVNPNFAHQINLPARLRSLAAATAPSDYTIREGHAQAVHSGLMQYGTELLDKVISPFSIEPRHPFLDKRLADFCLALPLSQKLQQGWTRAILRYAMADILPAKVQWRRNKGNLSANFQSGLLAKEQRILERVLFGEATKMEKYVDMPSLQKMYSQYASDPLPRSAEAITLSLVVILALWLGHSNLVT